MAVAVGIYEKLISIISEAIKIVQKMINIFFENMKKSKEGFFKKIIESVKMSFGENKNEIIEILKFLIPIAIGAVGGILLFSKLLHYLLLNYEMQTKFTFIGLILGSIPLLFANANQKGFKKAYIIPALITLVLCVVLAILEYKGVVGEEIKAFTLDIKTIFLLVLYGFIAAGSMVIPGISGSFILLLLGAYTAILSAVSNLQILILIPFALGVAVGFILIAKIIDYFLNNYYGYTYYAILGFIIGSIPAIFPGFSFDMAGITSIIAGIVGFIFSFAFSKLSNKEEKK